MKNKITSRKVVLISFLVDLIDVVTNLIVALITGSATIFSEMAQGIADSLGSVFLLIGERRSQKSPNQQHPLGYSREPFFWALLSAIIMLMVGGGLSLWRGLMQLNHPEPITSPHLAIIVIVIAICTNGYAVTLSTKKLISELGSFKKIFSNFAHPLVKGALLRDAVGTTTSFLGLFAIIAYEFFELIIFDALGAIISAILMIISSLYLIIQTRALITGQTLPNEQIEQINQIILSIKEVEAVNSLVAIYSGPKEILLETDLDLCENLNTGEIEIVLDQIESSLKNKFPNLQRVRVLLNSPAVKNIRYKEKTNR